MNCHTQSIRERIITCLCLCGLLILAGCSGSPDKAEKKTVQPASQTSSSLALKKVLFVNSYHKGYEWSDGITKGVVDSFNGKVNLKIIYMDSKRHKSEDFIKSAAIKATTVIESWQPDLVITADDNAFKYLVMPYFKNASLPIVFCGVNWDVSKYDNAPYKNTTGMIEIAHYEQLLKHLRLYAKGIRVGYLEGNNISSRSEVKAMKKLPSITLKKVYLVDSFTKWKKALHTLQDEVDMLLINNNAGIADWQSEEAIKLINNEVTIPTGSTNSWMSPYNMIIFAKSPAEQGRWAAQTALKILHGEKPANIAVIKSREAKIILNMKLAKKLGVIFPMDLINNADFVGD